MGKYVGMADEGEKDEKDEQDEQENEEAGKDDGSRPSEERLEKLDEEIEHAKRDSDESFRQRCPVRVTPGLLFPCRDRKPK